MRKMRQELEKMQQKAMCDIVLLNCQKLAPSQYGPIIARQNFLERLSCFEKNLKEAEDFVKNVGEDNIIIVTPDIYEVLETSERAHEEMMNEFFRVAEVGRTLVVCCDKSPKEIAAELNLQY